jgi:3-oxoadipate enol-lactonase
LIDRRVTVSEKVVDLYYEERGHGKPLILVHGFPLDHTIWNAVADQLKNRARIILPDLRGHGRSPVRSGVATMQMMAGDLARMLDQLKIEKAAVVGHSMGGYVALAFAREFPDRLTGLGMVSSQAAADLPERKQGRYDTAEKVQKEGVHVVADSMAPLLSNNPVHEKIIRRLIMTMPAEGVSAALKGMAERVDSTDFLSTIKVPVVVISGLDDKVIPIERSRVIAEKLAKVRLVELPGVGHMPMMEAPQAVAEALGYLL